MSSIQRVLGVITVAAAAGLANDVEPGAGWQHGKEEPMPWDVEALMAVPEIFEAPDPGADDIKAVFYESVPWHGRPTRVFAYYGIPELGAGEKAPAMVLVHGGGGSAFIPWVRLWVSRGFAAISMDTCGCISGGGNNNHKRHEHGGPPGWGGFGQVEVDQPIRDHWTYHAVSAVILAHSLIRSFPQVDPDRIGLTGISWGGYLVCIAAGIDSRFKFAAPVYGCGFLGDNSAWLDAFRKMGPEKARKWLGLWDPSVYLPRARMPMLWVTGSNDFAYPMDSLQKSYRLPQGPRLLCVRVRMPHGHGGHGENPREIHALAESLFRGGASLARIIGGGRDERDAWLRFESETPVVKAELNYTTDTGRWQDRKWMTIPAELDAEAGRVSAVLPEATSVYYFNIIDGDNLVASGEHEVL